MPEELKEIKRLLSEHISDSNDFRTEMKTDIKEIRVHGEYTKEAVNKHGISIAELQTSNNKQKGAMWVLGVMGLGGIAKFIIDLFK